MRGPVDVRLGLALARDGSGAAPRHGELVGSAGTVVTAIPAGGYGEVLLGLGGQPVKYAATAEDPVALGAEVGVAATPSSPRSACAPSSAAPGR
ncbi:hypothetical protein ACFCYH_11160 [Streptomyces sp. NPDC056400]|uniref:hypothetical protein n=1 Tax=Streptomyces sp. NPDC056400 TaxID=3345808 RepID=UPI0035D8B358